MPYDYYDDVESWSEEIYEDDAETFELSHSYDETSDASEEIYDENDVCVF